MPLKNRGKICPKCRASCSKVIEDPDRIPLEKKSSFCIIEAPRSLEKAVPNKQELISRMWAFLEPPNISGTLPLIDPERLEKVRNLISNPSMLPEENVDTHMEEELYVQVHPDRSILKIRSRTEIKLFHPSSADVDDDYCCPKPCNPCVECCKKVIPPCNKPKTLPLPSCKTRPFTSTTKARNLPPTCEKTCPNVNY